MSRDPDEGPDDFRRSVDRYVNATTHRDRTRRALPGQKGQAQAPRQKSGAFAGKNSPAVDDTVAGTQGRIGWFEDQGFMKPEKYKKLVLFFLAGMLSLHVAVAWRSRELIRKGYPDFTALYSAGKIVREGVRKQLYDSQTQYRIQQEFAAGVSIRQGPLPYIHPPWEALLFVPFAWFSYPMAYLLWNAVNVLILLSLPFLLRNQLPQLRHVSALFWLFVSLAFYPIFFDLLQGQDILPLLLFFTLAFVSLKQDNDLAAGCWLGLGLFRFHLVLPLMLILLLHRKRRALLAFLLVAFSLGLVSIATVGWQEALHYPTYIWSVENSTGSTTSLVSSMPNLRGFVHMMLPWTPRVAVAVSVVSTLILLLASFH